MTSAAQERMLINARKIVEDAKPIRVAVIGEWGALEQPYLMVLFDNGFRLTGALQKITALTGEQKRQIQESDPELWKILK